MSRCSKENHWAPKGRTTLLMCLPIKIKFVSHFDEGKKGRRDLCHFSLEAFVSNIFASYSRNMSSEVYGHGELILETFICKVKEAVFF